MATTTNGRNKNLTTLVVVLVIIALGVLVWRFAFYEASDTNNTVNNETQNEQVVNGNAYVGLSEADAIELADERSLDSRVVHRDGEDLPITMDYREDRLNFWVDDGEVFQALTDEEMTQQ